jgi:hypothetical protein
MTLPFISFNLTAMATTSFSFCSHCLQIQNSQQNYFSKQLHSLYECLCWFQRTGEERINTEGTLMYHKDNRINYYLLSGRGWGWKRILPISAPPSTLSAPGTGFTLGNIVWVSGYFTTLYHQATLTQVIRFLKRIREVPLPVQATSESTNSSTVPLMWCKAKSCPCA